jgi:hypothetical protein
VGPDFVVQEQDDSDCMVRLPPESVRDSDSTTKVMYVKSLSRRRAAMFAAQITVAVAAVVALGATTDPAAPVVETAAAPSGMVTARYSSDVTAPGIDVPAVGASPVHSDTADGELLPVTAPINDASGAGTVESGSSQTPLYETTDVDMAVAILTMPDNGAAGGKTHRWTGSTVTYSVNLDGYPEPLLGEVAAAIGFVESATSTTWVRVDTGAQIDIVAMENSNGGKVVASATSAGVMTHATVAIGCCRTRVVWEEILQAAGAFGDHGDARTVFSQTNGQGFKEVGDHWEAWVLNALYSVPAGSDPATVRAALTR